MAFELVVLCVLRLQDCHALLVIEKAISIGFKLATDHAIPGLFNVTLNTEGVCHSYLFILNF